MEKPDNPTQNPSTEVDNPNNDVQDLLQNLEKQRNWNGGFLCQYKGSWYPLTLLPPLINCQKTYEALETDIILATMPKAGTTWLKALTFSIVNRFSYAIDQTPLLHSNPHTLVPNLLSFHRDHENPDDLDHNVPTPRILATHMHYHLLPNTVTESGNCRVIYVCRNPLDQFISLWHFLLQRKDDTHEGDQPLSLEQAFEMYCQGIHSFGPFWEHVLGYWNAHLKNPEKVLFLKYEDLKQDISGNVKKIAEFIGYSFSLQEENQGLIEKISELCSFNSLKNLEVNQVGSAHSGVKNSSYFRKGEVGDWANYLSPSMVERIEKVTEMKLRGSGMTFNSRGNKN